MEQTRKEGIPKYKILNETYFGLNNKTPEQTTRTFLYSKRLINSSSNEFPFPFNNPESVSLLFKSTRGVKCVHA